MGKNQFKHLIVALGGVGLCIAGPTICTWFIATSKEIINMPFVVAGVITTIAGISCCVGAMLSELSRYEKK